MYCLSSFVFFHSKLFQHFFLSVCQIHDFAACICQQLQKKHILPHDHVHDVYLMLLEENITQIWCCSTMDAQVFVNIVCVYDLTVNL